YVPHVEDNILGIVVDQKGERLLSSPTCPVLEALGKKLSFEIAVGLNGRVWVNAESPSTIILVSNAIMTSESLSGVQQRIMLDELMQRMK
ncbi:Pnas-3-like protein, partial [Thalictrum thalictroides]